MIMLTGGEKYNVKKIIVKISENYPKIKELIDRKNYDSNGKTLGLLYNYTLEIFTDMYTYLTTNIINSSSTLSQLFTSLQQIHSYKDVNKNNKEALIEVVNRIPDLQEELINLVESDTTNRDAVLRQIMDELGIVDPNAKKKKSLW